MKPTLRARTRSAGALGLILLATVGDVMWSCDLHGGGLGELQTNRHNLSAQGPGTIRAQSEAETQICIFCHTPHDARSTQQLWNHEPTGASYSVYSSTTLSGGTAVLQPSGSSRLCLSCHDGTIAVGATRTHGTVAMGGTAAGGSIPLGETNLGGGTSSPDLSDDHPVSFTPSPSVEIVLPSLGDAVKLDAAGMVQCTSCHDPHNDTRDPNPAGLRKFLVASNQASAICQTCHKKLFWNSVPSIHASSSATWNGLGAAPFHTGYTTVSDNGCESCHRAHGAPGAMRLLKGQDPNNGAHRGEEWACVPCHDQNVTRKNVIAEFQSKPYVHPTFQNTPSVHDPTESPSNPTYTMPETSPAAPRHAECPDCHNPHAARNSPANAPAASGAIRQVSGVTSTGSFVAAISYEYELCFKCHSSSANKPQPEAEPYGPYATRVIAEFDTRLALQTSNPSFHPVLGARNGPDVPSLLAPYDPESVIYCTDCHNNDDGSNVGGAGPRGPHGSNYKRLLERRMELEDGATESASAYALCYKCHDRTSIIGDASFTQHQRHVVNDLTSCETCHDPHGVSSAKGGSLTNNSHLINFNMSQVSAVPGRGTPRYEETGRFHGRCYLVCHGNVHDPKEY